MTQRVPLTPTPREPLATGRVSGSACPLPSRAGSGGECGRLHLGSDNAWLHCSILSPQSSGHATLSLRGRNALQFLGEQWVAKQTAFTGGFSDTRSRSYLPPSVSTAPE